MHALGLVVRAIDLAERHRVLTILIVLALSILGGIAGAHIPTASAPEAFLAEGDPTVRALGRFRTHFGEDRQLAVTVEMPGGVLTPSGRQELAVTTRALARLPWVANVTSLDNLEITTREAGALRVGPLLPPGQLSVAALAAAHRRLADHPALRSAFLSEGGQVTTYVLTLADDGAGRWGPDERRQLLDGVEVQLRGLGVWPRVHLVGIDPVVLRIDEIVAHDRSTSLAVGVALTSFVVGLLIRDLLATAIVTLAPLVSLALTLGVFYLSGRPLTLIGALLPVLVTVYAFGDAVHVFYHLQTRLARRCASAGEAVASVLPTCALTSLTTAAGLGSLGFSDAWPVRDFGLLSAAGVLVAFVVDVTLLPILLRLPRVRRRLEARRVGASESDLARRTAASLGRLALRHPIAVVAGFGLLAALALPGVARLHLDSNFLHQLREHDPAREAFSFHDARLAGALPIEFLIESDTPGRFRSAKAMQALLDLKEEIDRRPPLRGSLSVADLVLATAAAIAPEGQEPSLPTDDAEIAELLLLASFSRGNVEVGGYLTSDARVARISAKTTMADAESVRSATRAVLRRARELFGPDCRVAATGYGLVFHGSLHGLYRGFQDSALMTALVVGTVLLGVTRSLSWCLVAMLVNLFPILVSYACLGWWSGQVWLLSLQFGAVALGIAVDDTLHVLGAVAREGGGRTRASVYRAIRRTGPGVVATSAALAAGFAAGASSEYLGIVVFAALLVLAMVVALLTDLLLLPALITLLPLPPLRHFGWGHVHVSPPSPGGPRGVSANGSDKGAHRCPE